MLKAVIKKEVEITNKEIAQYLWVDGSVFESIDETLENMLYDKYDMDYPTRSGAVEKLTNADYIEILQGLADRIKNDGVA